MNSVKSTLFLWMTFLLLSGCGSGQKNANQTANAGSALTPVKPIQNGGDGWVQKAMASDDGTVRVVRKEMTEQEREKYRNEYRRTNLVQLPVDAKYNATVFRINDVPVYARKAFIAPKIYAYGSQDGGRLAPRENSDGTVTLSFNVVFVDGATTKIPTPDSVNMMDLPDNFRVKDIEGLEQAVATQFGATDGLAPLPGCPKKILVEAGDEEFDATPSDLASGDHCQLNVPTVVSLRVPKKEARYILEEGLYDGIVEVRAVYETRVSFAVANVNISFDRQSIFRSLQAELGVHTAFVDADVTAAVTRVMREQMMKVSIQGDTNAVLDKLIQRVTDEFFEPFHPDPYHKLKQCSGSVVCLRLSYDSQNQTSRMDFSWVESTNAETGQNYLTWTKMKPLLDKTVQIGTSNQDCRGDNCARLMNDGTPRETGLTVVSGNLVVIQPSYLVKETRPLKSSTVQHIDHSVCVHQHETMEQYCHPHGRGGFDLCEERPSGHYECDRTENHWQDITTYFVGKKKFVTVTHPIGVLQQLLTGLYLRFEWRNSQDGKLQTMDCPLNVFKWSGDGKEISLRVENTPTCKPFTGNPNETPMLFLVSHIQFNEPYKSGKTIRNWDGSVVNSTKDETYIPSVEFAGTVAIRGYAFESANAAGNLSN